MTAKPTPHWPDCGPVLYEALERFVADCDSAPPVDLMNRLAATCAVARAALARAERSGDMHAWLRFATARFGKGWSCPRTVSERDCAQAREDHLSGAAP
ncbi:MAG: hypothetical protein A3E78_12200 [Alphaproteobacteria bacterium RIFCSPHIGHO2_12_FULL_63_12]|nr:MAG: hypothetical protein A3E78_12200 [Alphaproteobacteria bacterium RIFCSPHIGHO2_12_FULL_63_12]